MTRTLYAFVIAAALAVTATAGQAAPMNMTTGSLTSQPIGHHQFCVARPAECSATSGTERPAVLTQELWSAIVEINVGVNHTITPMTDQEIHGVEEVWSYPTTLGDCEDYVLLKRRLLSERGFDLSQLLITVVLQPDGSGHAVLTVRTDRGDFVLDNMRDRVMLWSDTEYVFLKRQSLAHAGQWSKINDSRDLMAVGSVR